jgi:DNA-binding transcriptional MerR regulator
MNKTYRDENGYRRYKDSDKLVHRAQAEKKLGRKLREGEVVHHNNRNKSDNSPENLTVFSSQRAHWNAHKRDAKKHGWRVSLTGFRRKRKPRP